MLPWVYISDAAFGWYALAYKATDDQAAFNGPAVVTFDGDISDVPSIHDTTTGNSKFIIPAAWNGRYGLMKANIQGEDSTGIITYLTKNGAIFAGGGRRDSVTAGDQFSNLLSAPVVLATGDEFEILADQGSSLGLDNTQQTWASFELLPSSYSGALVTKSTGQSVTLNVFTVLTFDTETYDLNNYHDNATNNSRLTTQSGDALVILYGGVGSGNVTGQIFLDMLKNGASFLGQPRCDAESSANDYICGQSAVVAVTGGTDYFELQVQHNTSTTIGADVHTFFSIRVLPSDTEYALVSLSADEDVGSAAFDTIAWDTETADTSGFWDAGSPTVFTIPSGKNGWYEISANLSFVSAANQTAGRILVDGAVFYGMAEVDTDTGGTDAVNLVTAPIYLTAGQTVSCQGYQASGGDVDAGDFTWFCIRKIEPPTS